MSGTKPVAEASVYVFRLGLSGNWEQVDRGWTNPDGSYGLVGLATGTYRVRFYHASYATEYFNRAPSVSVASDVAVTAGARLRPTSVPTSWNWATLPAL